MATPSEIGERVLEDLGAISAGDTPDDVDQTAADNVYDSVYAELVTKHSVSWGPTEDIPTAAELHITALVKNRIANKYGVPRSLDEEEEALKELKKLVSVDYSGEAPPSVYY